MTKTKATPSPFPTAIKRNGRVDIDPAMMAVEYDTPLQARRPAAASKYAELFGKLKPGACIRCESHEVGAVAHILGKKINDGGLPKLKGCHVKLRRVCEDGHARVWVLKDGA